jgi:hypothetical protein
MQKIFISHSSKDKDIVDIFVDTLLICGMGFIHNDIFCSSVEGLGIKTGEDWRNKLREKIINSKVIILFITPNYRESEICLNELGAAWTTDAKIVSVFVDPVNVETIGVLFNVKQAIRLTEGTDLDELKDSLQEFVSKADVPTAWWSTKKQKAIALLKQKLESTTFLTPLSRGVMTKLEKEFSETKLAFDNIVAENQKLTELCKKLEEAKDKNDVFAVKQDLGLLNDYDEFLSKAEKIGKEINKFDPVVRTIIFNDYTNKGLSLNNDDIRFRKDELNSAIARNIIYDNEHLNRQHKQVINILRGGLFHDKIRTFRTLITYWFV